MDEGMWIKGKGTCVWKPSIRFNPSPSIRTRTRDKNPPRTVKYETLSLVGVSEPRAAVPACSLLRLLPEQPWGAGAARLCSDLVWLFCFIPRGTAALQQQQGSGEGVAVKASQQGRVPLYS